MTQCPGWAAKSVNEAFWKPPLCRGSLNIESCAEVAPGYTLVDASGCGEHVVAVLKRGLGDAEREAEWINMLLSEPPPPFTTHCPLGNPGRVSGVQVVGGSERGFDLQLSTGGSRLWARVSRRAEFDNIEFAVLEYLTRTGYRRAPRLHCYVLYEGFQYMIITDSIEGELAGSLAVRDASPRSQPGATFASTLREIGRAVADLHGVMERCREPWCEPESVRESDISNWIARVKSRAGIVESLHNEGLIGDWATEIADALDAVIPEVMDEVSDALYSTVKMRIHGDLHLYQVIVSPSGVYLTDYEGEPYKNPASRLEKETPERDLASLLRSLDYAAALASRRTDGSHARDYAGWLLSTAKLLVDSYVKSMPENLAASLDAQMLRDAISFWMLERASYEAVYEIMAQTGLHGVPVGFLERVISGSDPILAWLRGEG